MHARQFRGLDRYHHDAVADVVGTTPHCHGPAKVITNDGVCTMYYTKYIKASYCAPDPVNSQWCRRFKRIGIVLAW